MDSRAPSMARIKLKLFASLHQYLPLEARATNALDLEVPATTTADDLIERFGLPRQSCKLVLIDGVFVPPDQRTTRTLRDGETVAIWPPVAGG